MLLGGVFAAASTTLLASEPLALLALLLAYLAVLLALAVLLTDALLLPHALLAAQLLSLLSA